MRCFSMTVLVASLGAAPALAGVPGTVGYNGVLFTCPASGPCDGYSYEGPMTFRLWDDAASTDPGHKVWEETQADVKLEGGWYHVDLGSVTALTADAFAGARWLEVQVGSDAPLAPRAVVGSVPYAVACGDSVTLEGKPPTAFAGASHVHAIAEVTGLQTALDGKAPSVHNHDGLYYGKAAVDTALAGKANVGDSYLKQDSDSRYAAKVHGHAVADVVGLQPEIDAKAPQATTYTKAEVDALIASVVAQCKRACPSDMVPVGDFCVERYESSIWGWRDDAKTDPIDCDAVQKAVDEVLKPIASGGAWGWTDGDMDSWYKFQGLCPSGATVKPALCSYRQYGSPPECTSDNGCDDYPTTAGADFPDSGSWTKPLYSCAVKGVFPSRSMTWFQAQQACGNSGRHLITNGEWQQAVAGTPDTTACNTNSAGPSGYAWKTGHGTCKSAAGVEDMIGNLWEWADLWGQAGPASGSYSAGAKATPWPASYGDGADGTWNINGSAYSNSQGTYVPGLPFAAIRGGYWSLGTGAGAFAFDASLGPSHWAWHRGARCARGL